MRGKQNRRQGRNRERRITPAHAGKTSTRRRELPRRADHPRACGENQQLAFLVDTMLGSPPRMRGKPVLRLQLRRGGRITPAHAGKTCSPPVRGKARTDHPRACGENTDSAGKRHYQSGSPPRMRGKLTAPTRAEAQARITPAHAGKTSADTGFSAHTTDHPRACGENLDFS